MQTLQLIHSQPGKKLDSNRGETGYLSSRSRIGKIWSISELPKLLSSKIKWDGASRTCGTGEFSKGLSIRARDEFCALATQFQCLGATVLITEEQKPSHVLLLLDGKVKVSMNSMDGRRFLLGVASAGDILGLISAVSGMTSEIRAESMYTCTIASLHRQDFLDFLSRHPVARQNVGRELGLHYARTCERLRMFGLISSVKSRLAGLLLEWCRDGRQTSSGTHVWCVLTHEEIGECIGASRETVTRYLTDFRKHGLMEMRGTILIIPNRSALAIYAGFESVPDPREPAA